MKLEDIIDRLRNQERTLTFVDEKGIVRVKTFHEAHRDALAVVERLKAAGVVPGCRVGIAARVSYAWLVWDLACIARGCVSVALPHEKPQRGGRDLIDAYRLSVLAVDADWLGDTGPRHERVHDIALDAAMPARRLAPIASAEAPGTHSLVFSSGTTGKTKGLVISAPGTEKLLDLYHDAFGVAPRERFLTFLPFANYQQRMIYYFCLYHRVDFVSVPFQRLFAGLKTHRPSFVIAPPVLYETLQGLTRASVGAAAASDREALSRKLAELTGGNIRYMVTGMAPIRRAALDFFWDCGIALYEAFGITEAGMVAWNKPDAVRVGTVGRPAEAGTVSLSDEGEVIVTRDALLSIGYFESSEEDARGTFVSPHAVATGDIAAFDDDGYLRIIGRKKDAIITRNGEKFHPEPIESMIHRDPRVGVAVVLASDRAGLAAVISTPQHDDPATTEQLLAHVAAVNAGLPAQQQVKHVVFTDREFSAENGLRTKNLKLNRKAIAAAFLAEA
jgi:long-chain acyl-CoA synthetase